MRRFKIEKTNDGRWWLFEEEFVDGCPYWSGHPVKSEQDAKEQIKQELGYRRPKVVHSEILEYD